MTNPHPYEDGTALHRWATEPPLLLLVTGDCHGRALDGAHHAHRGNPCAAAPHARPPSAAAWLAHFPSPGALLPPPATTAQPCHRTRPGPAPSPRPRGHVLNSLTASRM